MKCSDKKLCFKIRDNIMSILKRLNRFVSSHGSSNSIILSKYDPNITKNHNNVYCIIYIIIEKEKLIISTSSDIKNCAKTRYYKEYKLIDFDIEKILESIIEFEKTNAYDY